MKWLINRPINQLIHSLIDSFIPLFINLLIYSSIHSLIKPGLARVRLFAHLLNRCCIVLWRWKYYNTLLLEGLTSCDMDGGAALFQKLSALRWQQCTRWGRLRDCSHGQDFICEQSHFVFSYVLAAASVAGKLDRDSQKRSSQWKKKSSQNLWPQINSNQRID